MAATFVIACPECSKQVKVSEEHVGKKIRCKGCQHVFPVRAPGGTPPAPKKAGAAKTKAAPPPPEPEPQAEDDEWQQGGKYSLAATDDAIARCPFCAMQLESNEARICLNCGYDTVKRQRPEVKQVYAHTGFELFMWWLPAIMCILIMIGSIVWYLFFWQLIPGWLEDSWFEDEKGPPPTYIGAASPGFFRLYHAILIAFIWVPLIRFTYKRLFVFNKPPDKKMKDEFGNTL
ncbi:MAG TPA: hypothetical protein VM597_36685 [Gemmataceae bacterium]|nr:hypothetical protein [Gemmataceae bacterium]